MDLQSKRPADPRRRIPALTRLTMLTALAVLLVLASCSNEDSPTEPVPMTAEGLVNMGWSYFDLGNHTLARERFTAALGVNPTHGPADLGLAWCTLLLAGSLADYQAAATSFTMAIAHQETCAAAYAGRAASRLAIGGAELPAAISDANQALSRDPDFVFSHLSRFDACALRFTLASAHAALGAYPSALTAIAPDYPITIDPADPNTWVVAGTQHACYAGAVLAWLQQVEGVAGR